MTDPYRGPIAVTADPFEPPWIERARSIAEKFGLIATAPPVTPTAPFQLVVTPKHLELRVPPHRRLRPIWAEFEQGAAARQRVSGLSRAQPIARAVGIRGAAPFVVDATAGLGRDAFLLATLGCHVVALERSAAACALLADGLDRASRGTPPLRRVAERIVLRHEDARLALPSMRTPAPDVVYLDPMYAGPPRTALAKKEMRVFRELVGDDADASQLFGIARAAASRRVVVKRHPQAEPLGGAPDFSCKGKCVRYDVYLTGPAACGAPR